MIYKRTDARNDVTQAVSVFYIQNRGENLRTFCGSYSQWGNSKSEMTLVQDVEEFGVWTLIKKAGLPA